MTAAANANTGKATLVCGCVASLLLCNFIFSGTCSLNRIRQTIRLHTHTYTQQQCYGLFDEDPQCILGNTRTRNLERCSSFEGKRSRHLKNLHRYFEILPSIFHIEIVAISVPVPTCHHPASFSQILYACWNMKHNFAYIFMSACGWVVVDNVSSCNCHYYCFAFGVEIQEVSPAFFIPLMVFVFACTNFFCH